MKRLILLLNLFVCTQAIHAQIQSNCNPSNVLIAYYDQDIKHLALKRIYDLKSPSVDSIKIPEKFQDTIRKGLAAIFNLTNLKERDSVFDHYCIHQSISDKLFTSIYVGVDKSFAWTQQWKNKNITTGIPDLDKLLSTHGFTVSSYSNLINYAVLTTNQLINIMPLCDSLEKFAGVLYSEPQPVNGDGDKIIYTKIGNDRFYDFTVGYGDCQSGCTGKHTFKFKVNSNCSVNYLGVFDVTTSGYNIPKPINCNISATSIKKHIARELINIYPNPSNNHIFVETSVPGLIELYNLQGQLILNTAIIQAVTKIDLSGLPKGVYMLKASTDNGYSINKIIKD